VAKQLQELKMDGKSIGIVDGFSIAPSLPQVHHVLFTQKLPRSKFVNATFKYEELKAIPSEEEMAWFRKGAELTDSLHSHT
jgi:Xaa-Pro aminopeptidase